MDAEKAVESYQGATIADRNWPGIHVEIEQLIKSSTVKVHGSSIEACHLQYWTSQDRTSIMSNKICDGS